MLASKLAIDPETFTTFGGLLRCLRRRARLTQRDLGIAVGYSEGHINRFEKDKHLPDPSVVMALFIPALHLENESQYAQRLVELSQVQRPERAHASAQALPSLDLLESVPPAPPFEIARPQTLARVRTCLSSERCILLSGLAGVGKTTLAAALGREYARRMPVFWLTLTGGVTTSVDTLLHQLAIFLSGHGHAQIQSLLRFPTSQPSLSPDRLLLLLSAALNSQPVLLCFDNAEVVAKNEAFLQVLRHLCAATSASIILTSRETLPLAGICEITLGGLERAEGLALIGSLSEGRLNLEQAQQLFEKTSGNPMLIRLAVAQLMGEQVDASLFIERFDTQPQVASYLLETVQKQSSLTEWQILSLLAVFLKPVNLYDECLIKLAQALGPALAFSEAIASLQHRHLIDDATRAELNPLVRDYVYRTLSGNPSRWQRLHRLAGDWYTATSGAGLPAAHHYAAAGLFDETVDTIAQSEKEIIAGGDALSAVAVLDEVLSRRLKRHTQTDDSLRRLLVTRGYLLSATLRAAEAEENFHQALALATNPAVRADIVYRMRTVMIQRGHVTESLQLTQSARADLAPTDQLLSAQLLVAECRIQVFLGQYEDGRRSAEQAITLANQVAHISLASAEEIRSEAYYTLANLARNFRQVDAAIDYAQCSLASARRAGVRIREIACLAFIGGMLFDSGDLEGSQQYRRNALAGAQAIEDQVGVGYYLTHLANIDYLQLHPEQALEKLEQAIGILRDSGETRGLAGAMSLQAGCLLLLGKNAAARIIISHILNEMECQATQPAWGYYLNKLAMVQMLEKDTRSAQTTLQRALALPDISKNPMLYFELHTNLAVAQMANGDVDKAQGTLKASPPTDGLSRWVKLDRGLVEGYVAIAAGDAEQAACISSQMTQQSQPYPFYYQGALRLAAAIQNPIPASDLPGSLWVGIDGLHTLEAMA